MAPVATLSLTGETCRRGGSGDWFANVILAGTWADGCWQSDMEVAEEGSPPTYSACTPPTTLCHYASPHLRCTPFCLLPTIYRERKDSYCMCMQEKEFATLKTLAKNRRPGLTWRARQPGVTSCILFIAAAAVNSDHLACGDVAIVCMARMSWHNIAKKRCWRRGCASLRVISPRGARMTFREEGGKSGGWQRISGARAYGQA